MSAGLVPGLPEGPIRVRVPASSANLGPGFDAFGLALELHHEVVVEARPAAGRVATVDLALAGEGADELPRGDDNLVVRALRAALEDAGADLVDLAIRSTSAIPLRSGLGSSAAAWLAGRAAGELLAGRAVDREALLELGAREEGHGDNMAPCLHGGFTIVYHDAAQILRCRVIAPPVRLRAVVVVPDFGVQTAAARRSLPALVSRADAVHALSHASLLAVALATGQLDGLASALADRLHEPHRARLVPGIDPVRVAAVEAGALGVVLSGSGPSVLGLTDDADPQQVGAAMTAAWAREGIAARAFTPSIDRRGLTAQIAGKDVV